MRVYQQCWRDKQVNLFHPNNQAGISLPWLSRLDCFAKPRCQIVLPFMSSTYAQIISPNLHHWCSQGHKHNNMMYLEASPRSLFSFPYSSLALHNGRIIDSRRSYPSKNKAITLFVLGATAGSENSVIRLIPWASETITNHHIACMLFGKSRRYLVKSLSLGKTQMLQSVILPRFFPICRMKLLLVKSLLGKN